MPQPAPRPSTWEDLRDTPDDQTWEIVAGHMEAQPRPRPRHGYAQTMLSGALAGPFVGGHGGPGGWWLVIEPDVRLSEHDIIVPDVVGWRRERMPELPEDGPVDVIPDWICEILSPRTEGRDRVVKANLYLGHEVPYYWLLDPQERTLEALEARDGAWLRVGAWTAGDTPTIPPFSELVVDVASLFPTSAA